MNTDIWKYTCPRSCLNVYQNAPRCQRRDTGGTLMRYGFITPAHALYVSVHDQISPLFFWLPVFHVSACHKALCLLYLMGLFLLIGLYKMDFVHIHLYLWPVFSANVSKFKKIFLNPTPTWHILFPVSFVIFSRTLITLAFFPLCKYWHIAEVYIPHSNRDIYLTLEFKCYYLQRQNVLHFIFVLQ